MSWFSLVTSPNFLLALLLLFCVAVLYARLSVGWCKTNVCLNGKIALITGGSSGIGYETALGLAARGCRVIIAQRSNSKEIKEKIIKETGNHNIVVKQLDLSSLSSVRAFAKDINETEERLDILINNAGSVGLKNEYSKDGLHMGMQTNHFGPFLLTHLLIGLLRKSSPSRILFVSSLLAFVNNLTLQNLNYPHDEPPSMLSEFFSYSNAKLCNIITANQLSKALRGTGVTANSLHPGVVHTPIYQKVIEGYSLSNVFRWLFNECVLRCFAKDGQEGAQTTLYLATDRKVEKVSGKFFSDCRTFLQPPKARNEKFCRKIWEASEEFVKLSDNEKLL